MNSVFRTQRVEGCLRVLVAEDNGLIAMDIEQTLVASFAAIVLVAHTLEQALALLDADPPDLAIVNSDLGGTSVAPLAGRLVSAGAPFVVLSAMAPRALVDLAEQNARHLLEEFKLAALEADERASDPVYELQRELGLPRVPRSLACFDISHSQGKDTVASSVWFENGRAKRSEYRKFTIRDTAGIDDFKSMHEVVHRFLRRRRDEEKPLPDLVVIDGGKGQLNAALAALEALDLTGQPIVSLAKREEEVFVPGQQDPLRLPKRGAALRLLQQIRDEAHRFAITFQRSKRAARTITSELLQIPGVGPTRRRALLHRFGSVQGVRDAALEDIAAVPGFSDTLARRIHVALGVLEAPTDDVALSSPDSPVLS
jgi:excinuclease ABC subunit C